MVYFMAQKKISQAQQLLKRLNSTYLRLHKEYEDLFWTSYMGDHSVNNRLNTALKARDSFRADSKNSDLVREAMKGATTQEKKKLAAWELFFSKYQTPPALISLKDKIGKLETRILKKRSTQKEGYIDPKTKRFVSVSRNHMRTMQRTHESEAVRKACFMALQKLSLACVGEYVELVNLRNEYARQLGFEDFYAYKVQTEEGMTKKELFDIFDAIFSKTKYALKNIRQLEKKMPGLRKPWNFGYMMAGDFTREEDPYFQFDDALLRWGRSFAALGVDFKGGTLQLDLMDRKGKYNNGFCHWPNLVHYTNGKRVPGASNFTCNTVYGQVGSGIEGLDTLFHEGGHAAHYLNTTETEVCLNHEYPPSSTAWAETQSQFMDTIASSIEWKMRYAVNEYDQTYPFKLFEKKLRRLHILAPLSMSGILMVANFDKEIYEERNLTSKKVVDIAKKVYKQYTDYDVDSTSLLDVPHIYSWESAASYHGYGLADLAVVQWREYFYKKYGYIVDNPKICQEMQKVWSQGASKTFAEFVKLATGKKLSPEPMIKNITRSLEASLKLAQTRVERMKRVPLYARPVKLNAFIRMVDGKKIIADNKKSFEDMAFTYRQWIRDTKA